MSTWGKVMTIAGFVIFVVLIVLYLSCLQELRDLRSAFVSLYSTCAK